MSRAAFWLCILIAVMAASAAAAGLFWENGSAPSSFVTLRGETARIFGRGLYRYGSLFSGANYRGQDAVTLFLGVPLLVLASAFYRRGSLKGGLLLTGILAFFLYADASMALGAAYNPLFLLYVALLSAGFLALALTLSSIGTLPAGVLDLAIITPATVVTGALILRRSSRGYTLAFPLLGIIIMLLPTITLGTVSQIRAGVSYGIGEIVGPIGGFALLGALAIWVLIAIFRRLSASSRAEG